MNGNAQYLDHLSVNHLYLQQMFGFLNLAWAKFGRGDVVYLDSPLLEISLFLQIQITASKFASHVSSGLAHTLISTLYKNEFSLPNS